MMRLHRWLYWAGAAILLATAAVVVESWSRYRTMHLIEIYHAPQHYARRADTFTANITGAVRGWGTQLTYQLNDGPWRKVGRDHPRTPAPTFTIELPADELRVGRNSLELRAAAIARPPEVRNLTFEYDAAHPVLPLSVDWSGIEELDVQDGRWETFVADDGDWRVRPMPGFEGYDRVLVVAGAFQGGRRVRTDVVFRSGPGGSALYGFGIFPMWAGQPDEPWVSPRRGWRFSLAWYYSKFQGVATEFSDKVADRPPAWTATYNDLTLMPNRHYNILVEAWPETGSEGEHRRHRQRLKWWRDDEPEPAAWMEVADDWGQARLPPGEYAVSLISYNAQIDYGPVTIEPLNAPSER
jgi:hypothetical protein